VSVFPSTRKVDRACWGLFIWMRASTGTRASSQFGTLSAWFHSVSHETLESMTRLLVIFSHKPEIRTFAINFHGYNPQNRSQRAFKIEICRENFIYNNDVLMNKQSSNTDSARLGKPPARVITFIWEISSPLWRDHCFNKARSSLGGPAV
jgi:hypothetical protein